MPLLVEYFYPTVSSFFLVCPLLALLEVLVCLEASPPAPLQITVNVVKMTLRAAWMLSLISYSQSILCPLE